MRRDPRLVPLSREHHAPLRLGRQLIAGQGRDALRDMLPALTAHFSDEELSLAPLLRAGGETLLAERLLAEHRALAALFAVVLEGDREAEAGQALIDHVRFEERELFPAVEALLEPEGGVMTHVVTEACIRCKHTDCVDVCPVDAFREGPNFLVIDPEECIDCTLCIPECPVDAILPEEDLTAEQQEYLVLNARLAKAWPTIIESKPSPSDAGDWAGVKAKRHLLEEVLPETAKE